ncbi:MAG: bifunctional UDP-3-O-[3-hydroxymyristoyl] N-acetylglucosamine deacetylase/3-hydroxyacyl-ACP dehydratase [Longimicrobiaceae bacterium]
MTAPRQNTVAGSAELKGVGLHTGATVHLRVLPAEPDAGVVFRRTDLPGQPEVPAAVDRVVGTERGTTLGVGETRVMTVEHLLAAAASLQVDNLLVEIDAPEVPIGDGSAADFAALLQRAGIAEQDAAARVVSLDEPIAVAEGDASYVVAPSERFRVSTTIEWPHPLIGRQFGSWEISPDSFAAELANARTFGFESEVDGLRARGLARGGSMENAVVLTEDGLLGDAELRFPDEFVRHKTLDVVGDLSLVGRRFAVHVVAQRPGHRGNVAVAKVLAEARPRTGNRPALDIQKILEYLPHRYPFLLVDRVIEYEAHRRIVGLKNVTINEPFFVGHFPGRPTMPGVLIIEAMAQVGGLLMMDTIENPEDKIVYFMSLDKVKWRRPVVPGDQILFELNVLQIRNTTCRMRGVGSVDGQVVAEAEMMARVVDR